MTKNAELGTPEWNEEIEQITELSLEIMNWCKLNNETPIISSTRIESENGRKSKIQVGIEGMYLFISECPEEEDSAVTIELLKQLKEKLKEGGKWA